MLELYQRQGCPSCAEVRRALELQQRAYRSLPVPKLGSERAAVLALEGVSRPTVPVLVDEGKVVQGKDQILAHLSAKTAAGSFRDPSYGLTRRLSNVAYSDAIPMVKEALAAEGFGVLTEIDVRATLKKKIDVDFPNYVILGACNPPLAHQALSAEPAIGLLLPCNVVVASDPNGEVVVSAIDPMKMFSVIDSSGMEPIAMEVRSKLSRALAALKG